ncbi:uncharacterized protein GlcG (DUF336 family) [Rhodococcus sp. 27YEA15]|uniref:GlcG/HbpS family heme-binding protein n=1 Tax=Rhodococcus sp. 27YEA15 TaxID=3156259 RepID=UPI003C7E4A0E
MNLSLAHSRTIIAGALAAANTAKMKPLTIVVLDAGGHVLAAEREDGSSNKRFDVAYGKAHGAVSLGVGSRALMTRAEQQPSFIAAVTHSVGALVPVPGGVLIKDTDGTLLGAVGVSGDTSDNDEEAALAGVTSIGLMADAG